MKNFFTTKRLCRAGIIAALYTALTYAFAPLAFGPFQVRPAEALCILAVIYPEAVFALTVGCALSNLASPYAFYDVTFGSMITLSAALFSYLVGSKLKNVPFKVFWGGFFPVLLNAIFIPFLILFIGGVDGSLLVAYFTAFGSLLLTQSVWIYGLGTPLFFTVSRLRKKGLRFLCD